MNYIYKLSEKAKKSGIVCVGFDPAIEKIPLEEKNEEKKLAVFFTELLKHMKKNKKLSSTIKPNIAFFEQHGLGGLKALKKIISKGKKNNLVILDAKRGDIGKTAEAYAKAVFEHWNADAVTVPPYMGADSIKPFTEYCGESKGKFGGKGVYILCRTSNPGAKDLQDFSADAKPLYMHVAEKIVNEWYVPGIGAVVGATYPEELEKIAKFFVDSGKKIPLLIPGIGAQGGSAVQVVETLKKVGYDLSICRINSSSGIIYAWEKEKNPDFGGAAIKALTELNSEIKLN